MNYVGGLFGLLLIILALIYAIFMFIFPFLIINKITTLIDRINYLIKVTERKG